MPVLIKANPVPRKEGTTKLVMFCIVTNRITPLSDNIDVKAPLVHVEVPLQEYNTPQPENANPKGTVPFNLSYVENASKSPP